MRRAAVLGALALSLAGPAGLASASAPASAAARACDRVVDYRYDVTVTGAKSARETFPPASEFTGEFTLSYAYTVRYRRVRVRVDRGCDPEIDTVRARAAGSGTLENYAWADHSATKDPTGSGTKQPCEFQFTTDPLAARLRLAGGTTVAGGGPSTLSLQTAIGSGPQRAVLDLIETRRNTACDKGDRANFRASDELALHRSVPIFERPARAGDVRVEPPSIFLDGSLTGGARRKNPRALARLVAGRSARVSTGVRSYEGTDDQSSASATTSVTIRFDRRR